ncbi:MAG: HDOD domain-containing protein [candidate division Zixibacteria bacterium]|nr:HDOD domain-containing protein [candidate division Zixibacteria bacterium]
MTTATIDNKVKQVVSNIRNLPTPPIVFHQIQKVINDPNCSAAQVASILSEDPAMSVKVLKLTNSAFYGLAREIDSVRQAVVIVGMEAVKNLVLSASVLDMFKGDSVDQEFQEQYWRHSLATAYCCRILAQRIKSRGMVDHDAAFSAGLLHDVGKMILTSFLKEEHEILTQARATDNATTDCELEEKSLGFNHAQIGGFLTSQWKLPQKLSEAIAFHHHPQLVDTDDGPLVFLVWLADYLAKKTFYDDGDTARVGAVDPDVLEYLAVSEEDLEQFSGVLREEYLKAETFLQMAGLGG